LSKEKKKRRSKGFVTDGKLVVGQRKLVKIGDTYYISVPKEFVEQHKLEPGEKLCIAADHIMKVIPMPYTDDKEDIELAKKVMEDE